VDGVVDGDSECHGGRHDRPGVHHDSQQAHGSEDDGHGEEAGHDQQQARRQVAHEEHHGDPDEDQVADKAQDQAVEHRVLGLVDQRHQAGVGGREPFDALVAVGVEDGFDDGADVLDEFTVVQVREGAHPSADAPQLLGLLGAEVVAEVLAVLVQLHNPRPAFHQPGPFGQGSREGRRRQGAADLGHGADRLLDRGYQLHLAQQVELALLLVHADDDFHGHQRPQVLFQPGIVVEDPRIGREKPHELDRGLDLGDSVGADGHQHQAAHGHQLVAADDELAGRAPPRREPGIDDVVRPGLGDPLQRPELEHRRHVETEHDEAHDHPDCRVDAEHLDRHQLADPQRGQTERGRAGGQGQGKPSVGHRPIGGSVHAMLPHGVAVIVGQMDGAGGRRHIHQRRHGQQNGVHPRAGVPDHGQAQTGAEQGGREHHRGQPPTAEAPPGHEQPDDRRYARQAQQRLLAFDVDRHVVDRRTADVQPAAGDAALLLGHPVDPFDGRVKKLLLPLACAFFPIPPFHGAPRQGQHQAGLLPVLPDQAPLKPAHGLFGRDFLLVDKHRQELTSGQHALEELQLVVFQTLQRFLGRNQLLGQ